MSKQHMNPEDALHAFRDLGARNVVAMHWGTFKLTDEPLDEPPALFRQDAAARGLTERVARVAAVGETIVAAASTGLTPASGPWPSAGLKETFTRHTRNFWLGRSRSRVPGHTFSRDLRRLR